MAGFGKLSLRWVNFTAVSFTLTPRVLSTICLSTIHFPTSYGSRRSHVTSPVCRRLHGLGLTSGGSISGRRVKRRRSWSS